MSYDKDGRVYGAGGRGQSEYSDGEAMQTYLQFTLKA